MTGVRSIRATASACLAAPCWPRRSGQASAAPILVGDIHPAFDVPAAIKPFQAANTLWVMAVAGEAGDPPFPGIPTPAAADVTID